MDGRLLGGEAAAFGLARPPLIREPSAFNLAGLEALVGRGTIAGLCVLARRLHQAFHNQDLEGPPGERFVAATLAKYEMGTLTERAIPVVVQVARFDPWKDPLGVIEAHRAAREHLPQGANQPHLVLVGPLADDDPEADSVLAGLRAAVSAEHGGVHVVPLRAAEAHRTSEQEDALRELGLAPEMLGPGDLVDLEINAFQTRADVIIAKSLREGFGLAVTGAGYHGKPRIVSEVGGLPAQVIDGRARVHACLVGGRPFDREASIRMTRDWLLRLLVSPTLRSALAASARRHVLRTFLPHRHLADYYRLSLDLHRRRLALHAVDEPQRGVALRSAA
ncbi:MAG: glycosyltransferase [Candidatus Methylomirabilia bacterium]